MHYAVIAALLTLPLAAQDPSPAYLRPPSEHKTFNEALFGKHCFIRSGISTTITQIADGPREWGQGPEGLGKRFASSFGRHLIRASVQYSMAETLRQDLRYHPSDKSGFGGRLKHALASTVVARNMDTGAPTFASARITGVMTAGFISRSWMPDRLQTVGSGFRTSGISLGFEAGFNVFREFWPDIRGKRRQRSDIP